jgi:hypothetical protein
MGVIDKVRLFRAFSESWDRVQSWQMGQEEKPADCKRSFRAGFFAGEAFATSELMGTINRQNLEISELESKISLLNDTVKHYCDRIGDRSYRPESSKQ